ncbi:MAG TPA: pentapeptide repeat-containing protein, partial [Candidatus Cybelea sp.]|nr:pentapeptide repeat-containing protein [Candidatus Cybelea sp.]
MSPETRPIGHVQPLDAELQALLAQHKTYVNSRGKQGKLADLTGADLTGADLSGIDLRGATLRYARLDNANLLRANL